MSSERIVFTKENVDFYLKELGKEYRKLNGKGTPAELILIGGASVLVNYGFREMTTDIDVLMHAASTMKEAIYNIGERYDLPSDWLNSDFKRTDSFTFKLFEFSKYYKTYYGVLTIRVISAEYLVAMKLMSGRKYKNDKSDVIGILAEHEKKNKSISYDKIKKAVTDLYGDWSNLPEDSQTFKEDIYRSDKSFEDQYREIRQEEIKVKNALISFRESNPGVINKTNFAEIIDIIDNKIKSGSE